MKRKTLINCLFIYFIKETFTNDWKSDKQKIIIPTKTSVAIKVWIPKENNFFFLISINLNEENISVECSDIMYEMFPLPLQFTFWECPMKLEIQMDWTLGAVVTT